ncbi:DNA primase catalytic subunit PriS [Methanobacterium petrolearium]|uniref:DNA primase catalytic subunit PriS n=1 Tax=Methanobacterium petrolearium TaxID=710190 RepID=UPI001AE35264|nr:DNA primase catalytic subunit PriS [Methanobacterium petrolearium]MBP1946223.1 DNA primase small subunit [Methanobacterium petrolearium]BDZ71297.1 DNA primase [Methanobacterium petrolearium]
MELKPANPNERRQYYREEWNVKNLPDFILKSLIQREFGFDHMGRGPNDRYRVFQNTDFLRKFMRYRAPFAAYSSVAFYHKPRRRDGWIKAELVFDVDAKDIPIRSCGCDNVCEICLNQAKDIVHGLVDTLKGDLGLSDIHVVYSGRGYHIRVLDDLVTGVDSDVRSQIVKYLVGSDVPRSEYSLAGMKYNLEHFTIPFGYPLVFTNRVKQAILALDPFMEMDGVNDKLIRDAIKHKDFVDAGEWGIFRSKIGPIRYSKLIKGIASLNLTLVDAKVSIDLKRILRLPSSLHSGVSMKCTEIKNLETFDPFKDAVPKFVYERKD